jgi:UDP-glucose 4-epimerase
MRILVTGASGFLGRHVAHHLAKAGHEVTGLDRVAFQDALMDTVQVDLLDGEALTQAARGHDAVCHLGAIGDVYLAASRPDLAASVNVTGSANVAQAAVATGARVVYASTWEVYGSPQFEPITEDHPCRPDHPYNITKLAGERMIMAATELQGLSAIALRLGTAYGSGMRPNSVFRIFADRALRGEPITIQGSGLQGRQFTHAADISGAFEMACAADIHSTELNVVGSEMVTIRQLAELVVERYPTELTYGEPRPGDIAPATVSGEKARSVLGWAPGVSFRAGLEDVFADAEAAAG